MDSEDTPHQAFTEEQLHHIERLVKQEIIKALGHQRVSVEETKRLMTLERDLAFIYKQESKLLERQSEIRDELSEMYFFRIKKIRERVARSMNKKKENPCQ